MPLIASCYAKRIIEQKAIDNIKHFKQQQHLRPSLGTHAALFGLLGALLFTINDATIKWFSQNLSITQILFIRSCLAFLVAAIWIKWQGGVKTLVVKHPRTFALSLIANIISWFAFYNGLALLPFTLSICIFFLTPVVTSVLAMFMLNELPSKKQVVALLLGFLGVLVLTNPWAELQAPLNYVAVGYILISVFMWSVMAVFTRALVVSMTVGTTLFYNNLLFFIVTAFILFMPIADSEQWRSIDLMATVMLLLLGGVSVFAQACCFQAYRLADTNIAATTEYSALVWAAIIGYWLWDETITPLMMVGIACIVGAGFIVLNLNKIFGSGKTH